MDTANLWWNKKRVLVTGHTGFVGTWLCAALNYFGADIYGLSLPEENNSLYAKIKGEISIKTSYCDLRDRETVCDIVNSVNPQVVFHLAALAFLKDCHQDPQAAYTTNVNGTVNLLDALRIHGNCHRIIIASSDKVYKNVSDKVYLFSETDKMGGDDTYSASKTCEDIIAQSYYNSYMSDKDISMCIIRPSNIIGGGDGSTTRLIPGLYQSMMNGVSPEIRNPDSVRPWQSILDIVDAYLTVGRTFENGLHIYNVGPEPYGIKSVGEIADYVGKLCGCGQLNNDNGDGINSRKGEVKEKEFLGLSINKIYEDLNWSPRRTLEDTLRDIYYFYEKDNGINTYNVCMSQIERYYLQEGNAE